MTNSVSTIGVQLLSTTNLQAEQSTLALLNEQLASGTQHDNLTNYDPTSAHNLINFQNAVTQSQAYISSMQTINTRLQIYNSTLGDMSNIASQAGTLATQSASLDPATESQVASQVQTYLKQVTDDLNQQIGGRYIYAGTRYTTVPVVDLSTLNTTPTVPFTPTTSPALTDYDAQNVPTNSFTVNSTPSGNFQFGNDTIPWSAIESGNVTSVDVNGTPTSVNVTGLSAATTPAEIASNLQATLSQIKTQVSDFSNLSASVNGATVTLNYTGDPVNITPTTGETDGQITWADSTDGTQAENMATTNAAAYTSDSVNIDSNFSLAYGVTSNNPAIQQLIAGLQLMNAATQSGVSSATYQTDMTNASNILNSALTALQGVNTTVASNINTVTQETSTQNNDITNLQNEISNIQQVNITQVGTEINTMQTQLQASYSATASLLQESLVKYL